MTSLNLFFFSFSVFIILIIYVVVRRTILSSKFRCIKEFNITIPNNYQHEVQLKRFSELRDTKCSYYNSIITDHNFARVTHKLIPGKTYAVRIYQILKTVTSENCLAFLKLENAVLVGPQGLSLLFEKNQSAFPLDAYLLSFDKREVLPTETTSPNNFQIPGIYVRSYKSYWDFDTIDFNGHIGENFFILSFSQ